MDWLCLQYTMCTLATPTKATRPIELARGLPSLHEMNRNLAINAF